MITAWYVTGFKVCDNILCFPHELSIFAMQFLNLSMLLTSTMYVNQWWEKSSSESYYCLWICSIRDSRDVQQNIMEVKAYFSDFPIYLRNQATDLYLTVKRHTCTNRAIVPQITMGWKDKYLTLVIDSDRATIS